MPTREPGRTSKLMSLSDAAALVTDGSSVAIGGVHAHNAPMALIRELARRGLSNLTIIPSVSVGLPAELLIAARAVKRIYTCYVGLEHHGLAPAFRRQAQDGTLEVHDVDEAFLVYAMRAGAASLPFMAYPRGHEAVDLVRLNTDDFRRTTDPFTGEEVTVIRPLRADFGLLHVPCADPFGNVMIEGSVVQDILIAKSSMHVIVTAEEIVPVEETIKDPSKTTVAGLFVDTVVHVPCGAHPASCHGRYQSDEEHIKLYQELGPDRYVEEYVHQLKTQADYLRKIGADRLLSLMERMVNRVE